MTKTDVARICNKHMTALVDELHDAGMLEPDVALYVSSRVSRGVAVSMTNTSYTDMLRMFAFAANAGQYSEVVFDGGKDE